MSNSENSIRNDPGPHRNASHWSQLWPIAWRWLFAGLIGSLTGYPLISLILGFALLTDFFNRRRTLSFWRDYRPDFERKNIRLVRLALLGLGVGGLVLNWTDRNLEPYLLCWLGFVVAMLIESYRVEKMLSEEETAQ